MQMHQHEKMLLVFIKVQLVKIITKKIAKVAVFQKFKPTVLRTSATLSCALQRDEAGTMFMFRSIRA